MDKEEVRRGVADFGFWMMLGSLLCFIPVLCAVIDTLHVFSFQIVLSEADAKRYLYTDFLFPLRFMELLLAMFTFMWAWGNKDI